MSEIQSGRYAVGERMPGEFELVEKHNVSRHTVRESLRVLEDLGLIDRHQGHGTVVRANTVSRSYVHAMKSLSEMMQYPDNSAQITLRCTPLDPQCSGDGMMDEFEMAGYGKQPVGFGTRCAVLIIDFQKAFTDSSSALAGSDHVNRAVDNTAILLTAAKAHRIPVASSRVAWNSCEEMPYWKIPALFDGSFFTGHPLTEIDSRIADPDYVFEFTKTAPSIFFRTPLAIWLTKHNIDTTIIAGCTTSGCVRASIVDSFSYGYRTIVAEDCCGDHNESAHRDNLRDVGRRYADVVKLSEVLGYFESLSPEAKLA